MPVSLVLSKALVGCFSATFSENEVEFYIMKACHDGILPKAEAAMTFNDVQSPI